MTAICESLHAVFLSFVPTGALNIAAYALIAHYVKNTITCLHNTVKYHQHFDMIDLFSKVKLFQSYSDFWCRP